MEVTAEDVGGILDTIFGWGSDSDSDDATQDAAVAAATAAAQADALASAAKTRNLMWLGGGALVLALGYVALVK